MKDDLDLERVPDEDAERIACIVGDHSAHSQALAECRLRRGRGEDAHVWRSRRAKGMVFVGPTPAALPPAGGR